jgi:FKBP-type peptidyl-prolyl cis-trans isomerase SlyD
MLPVEAENGMSFEAQDPQGNLHRIVVKSVDGYQVTTDANHPLAEVRLNFDVQVIGVRDATPEEIEYGHAH